MMLAGTTNIRDVIAFPKNQRARDLMTGKRRHGGCNVTTQGFGAEIACARDDPSGRHDSNGFRSSRAFAWIQMTLKVDYQSDQPNVMISWFSI